MAVYFYELVNPATDLCFYVGITKDANRRYEEHLAGQCLLTEGAISALSEDGVVPVLHVVERFSTHGCALAYERAIIRQSRRLKIPLCNNRYGRGHFPNKESHGRRWLAKDKTKVRELHLEGFSRKEIAAAMERTVSSIRYVLLD